MNTIDTSLTAKRAVFVDGQHLADVCSVYIPEEATARSVVEEAAKLVGVAAELLRIFREDEQESMALDAKLEVDADGITLHIHQAEKVRVKVNYKEHQKEATFSPATRIQVVLDWVVGPHGFHVDSAIAPEMELALAANPVEEVPRTAHLGRYVSGHHHEVDFDLVRGIIPNGAP